jgi:hypothetical protein
MGQNEPELMASALRLKVMIDDHGKASTDRGIARRRPCCAWTRRDGVMDKNDINEALHEISMMVSFVLYAVELQVTDTTPRIFQMPDEAGEMLCFGLFDIDKRVKALKAALYPRGVLNPRGVLSLVRDPA